MEYKYTKKQGILFLGDWSSSSASEGCCLQVVGSTMF